MAQCITSGSLKVLIQESITLPNKNEEICINEITIPGITQTVRRVDTISTKFSGSVITWENTASIGKPLDFVTSSYFEPYITTVGLYNENFELLAVGKLAQPLQSSPTTDTTILVNIDR